VYEKTRNEIQHDKTTDKKTTPSKSPLYDNMSGNEVGLFFQSPAPYEQITRKAKQ